jgi:hypothetical protein
VFDEIDNLFGEAANIIDFVGGEMWNFDGAVWDGRLPPQRTYGTKANEVEFTVIQAHNGPITSREIFEQSHSFKSFNGKI